MFERKTSLASIVLTLGLLTAGHGAAARASSAEGLVWSELAALPQPVGGPFVGVLEDQLLVAGGAHFPTSLFAGGEKQWVADVFSLGAQVEAWRRVGSLPQPRAYGGAIALEDGLLLIGGGDATAHTTAVTEIRIRDGQLAFEDWPALPQPNAFCGVARLGDHVYVAGGRVGPSSAEALGCFWRLDLNKRGAGWETLSSWPGPARLLPVVVAQDGGVLVASGAELITDAHNAVQRRYLADAYFYKPSIGWKACANLPRPAVAAPAAAVGSTHVLIFGGDTGALADQVMTLKDDHPGFSREILAYHTVTDTWRQAGTLPATPVTTAAVSWRDQIVIPTGEDRPAHRSPAVHVTRVEQSQAVFKAIDYVMLAIYLAALVAMGVYFSRRERTTDDFFLGGRRVPWWAAGLSIFGTQLSAITFMAIPAKSYATDWTFILANMCIVLIAPVVVFFYLPFLRGLNITTAYEYLEKRFNVLLRLFGSVSFILFQLGRMGIVLFLPAIALSTVTGLDIYVCIIAMGILCTIYTVLGGIEAVIWTDVLQVIVLMGGAILSLIIIVWDIDGGLGQLFEVARSDDKLHTFNWSWDYAVTAVWVVVIGNIFTNLVPYTTDQTVIQRYLTTSSERMAARAVWTNAVLTIPASVVFFGVGTALYVFYKTQPEFLNPLLKNDAIFPWFVAQQLPAGISGIVIAGLFAAAMSSLDSSMNSVAAAITTDFHERFSPRARRKNNLRLARTVTILLGVIGTSTAALMASYEVKSLWDLFLRFIGLFGGSLAGVFALGIFTTRTNGAGALVGALAGVIAVFATQQYTAVHFFLYAGVGIVVCFGVGYAVSLVTPASHRDLTDLTLATRQPRGA